MTRLSIALMLVVVAPYYGLVDCFLTPVGRPSLLGGRMRETVGESSVPSRLYGVNGEPKRSEEDSEEDSSISEQTRDEASKRQMLRFAVPALGIYLTNPLLSNIDNAFVGRTVGVAGLAALSPATMCTDQMLYLFSFLGRATTGIVSRAYYKDAAGGNTEAAREAASAPLTVSLICGVCLSLFYMFLTPSLLAVLNVNPSLRPAATSYIHWRGAIAWAALSQSVCLSIMMATRDSVTPLKIVALAAIVNVLGDACLCSWPLRLGTSGAAAATSFATLFSCFFMLKALAKKKILPKIRWPTKQELWGLTEFTGPLLAITITRLGGFVAMQRAAMKLGVEKLAGYQLCFNLLLFFMLFGEPLSQLSQTKLPSLLDQKDGTAVLATLKSTLLLATFTSIGVAGIAFGAATFGSGIITSDAGVQLVAKATAPALFLSIATGIFTVAVDGAMLASKDFSFMLLVGLGSFVWQLKVLPTCHTVASIFGTFTIRLGTYAVAALGRIALGYGGVGKVVRPRKLAIETAV